MAATQPMATPLHPRRVPQRVIAHGIHDSRAQRVGDDVSRYASDLFFTPDRAVVVTALPGSAQQRGGPTDKPARSRFHEANARRKRLVIV